MVFLLQEELMRLRSEHHVTSPDSQPSSPSTLSQTQGYARSQTQGYTPSQTQGFSPLMIITVIAMAVFGIVIGKFFLWTHLIFSHLLV